MSKRNLILLAVLVIMIVVVGGIFALYNPFPKQEINEKVEVKLYFASKDAQYLEVETREVSVEEPYLAALQELIAGPRSSSLSATIPAGVEVLGMRIENGIAFVDFNRDLVDNHWGGSTGETLTVYSIVYTLTEFPEIEKIQFLVEGEKIETLAGHLYLLAPIEREGNLLKKEAD